MNGHFDGLCIQIFPREHAFLAPGLTSDHTRPHERPPLTHAPASGLPNMTSLPTKRAHKPRSVTSSARYESRRDVFVASKDRRRGTVTASAHKAR